MGKVQQLENGTSLGLAKLMLLDNNPRHSRVSQLESFFDQLLMFREGEDDSDLREETADLLWVLVIDKGMLIEEALEELEEDLNQLGLKNPFKEVG